MAGHCDGNGPAVRPGPAGRRPGCFELRRAMPIMAPESTVSLRAASMTFCPRLIIATCLILFMFLFMARVAANEDALALYLELRVGTFSSEAHARADQRYSAVSWHIAERPYQGDGARWLYLEAWMPDAAAPYLQRLIAHHLEADGTIIAQPYRIPEAEALVGAWQDTARLAALDLDRLEPVAGCELEIVRTGPERFEGQTRGARCLNTHRGAHYAVSQSLVTSSGAVNWDRGFAADGSQVWGPSAGGYRFRRVQEGLAHCDTPVRLLVFGRIHDRQAFAAYGQALMASGLYARTGGYWTAVSPMLQVFEGDPPPGRAAVISHFPCLEAAREFWFDPQYQQEIIPLRQGISDFEVLVLPTVPIPDSAP